MRSDQRFRRPFCRNCVIAAAIALSSRPSCCWRRRCCAGARAGRAAGDAVRQRQTDSRPKPQVRRANHRRKPSCRSVDPATVRRSKRASPRKAIDKVKQVAKSAGDIFSRVPCLPPKGGAKSMGSLPHVAGKLAAGKPVVIVAFGSSSTQGYGSHVAGIHLSQPAGGAVAPAISGRRHHRAQSRQGRRGRARNDEAAADRGDRREAGSGDLAGRHQRRAAQPRSGGNRQAGRGRHRAHSGRRRRSGAGRSAIFARGERARRKRQQDGEAARQGRRASPCRHSSRASR